MKADTRRRRFTVVWISYFTVCMLALIWPFASIANSIEPRVAGFPFFCAWYVAWVLLIFVGSVLMYVWDSRLPGKELDDE